MASLTGPLCDECGADVVSTGSSYSGGGLLLCARCYWAMRMPLRVAVHDD